MEATVAENSGESKENQKVLALRNSEEIRETPVEGYRDYCLLRPVRLVEDLGKSRRRDGR